jgi:hypothetical protein
MAWILMNHFCGRKYAGLSARKLVFHHHLTQRVALGWVIPSFQDIVEALHAMPLLTCQPDFPVDPLYPMLSLKICLIVIANKVKQSNRLCSAYWIASFHSQ